MLSKLRDVLKIREERKASEVVFLDPAKMSRQAINIHRNKSEFGSLTLDDKFRRDRKLLYL